MLRTQSRLMDILESTTDQGEKLRMQFPLLDAVWIMLGNPPGDHYLENIAPYLWLARTL